MFFRHPLLVRAPASMHLHRCYTVFELTGLRVLMAMQVRSICYDYWSQCDPAFGAELKVQVEESLKKM